MTIRPDTTFVIQGRMGTKGNDWKASLVDIESGVTLRVAYGPNPQRAFDDLMGGLADLYFERRIEDRNAK